MKVVVQVPAPLPNLLSSSTLLLEIARVPAQVHAHTHTAVLLNFQIVLLLHLLFIVPQTFLLDLPN